MKRAAILLITASLFCCLSLSAADLATQLSTLRNSSTDAARSAAIKAIVQQTGSIKTLVPALNAALLDKSADVRAGAAQALGQIGLSARDATPQLARMAADRDDSVRLAVAGALGEICAPSGEVFCALTFLLRDTNANVRTAAVDSIGKFGRAAEPTRAVLRDLLTDPAREIALSTAISLALTGEPAPEAARLYVQALTYIERHKTAEFALRTLGALGLAALEEAVQDSKTSSTIRREAAAFLGRWGEGAVHAVPALRIALADADKELQCRAAQALVELNAATPEAAPAILRGMRSGEADYRNRAIDVLEKMGPGIRDAALAALDARDDGNYGRREMVRLFVRLAPLFKDNPSPLIERLKDADDSVRACLIDALAKSGAPAAAYVDALIPLLKVKGAETSQRACQALGAMRAEPKAIVALADLRVHGETQIKNEAGKAVLAAGAGALPALSILKEALASPDDYTRSWALRAIENIGPAASDVIPTIAEHFFRGVPMRSESARVLGVLGEKSIPVLIDVVRKADWNSRIAASAALAQIGAPAIEPLREMLRGTDPDASGAAAYALEKLAPLSLPALPDLIVTARSKSDNQRNYSMHALAKLGELAIPALLEELRKSDDYSRRVAEAALGHMGPNEVPAIMQALRAESNPDVMASLLVALGQIGPKAAASAPLILDVAGRQNLGKDRAKVWGHCARALSYIGGARDQAVPVLFEMLSSEERDAHSEAYSALTRLAGEDLRVPPLTRALRYAPIGYVGVILKKFGQAGMEALFEELNAGDASERDRAAQAFPPLVPECIPFLMQHAADNPANTLNATLALGEIRVLDLEKQSQARRPAKESKFEEELRKAIDSTTPFLQKLTQSPSADEAIAALWALGKLQGAGSETIAQVVKHLVGCSAELKPRGIRALRTCDTMKQARAIVPALPLLMNFASDPANNSARKDAMTILSSAGYCPESVPALVAAIQDGNSTARNIATEALKGLGAEARPAIPKLIALLDRTNNSGYTSANAVLTSIGADSVPPLLLALRAESPRLREGALNAIHSLKLVKLAPYIQNIASLLNDEREDVCTAALHVIRNMDKDAARPAEPQIRALLGRNSETLFEEASETLKRIGGDMVAALGPYASNENDEIALRALGALRGAGREKSSALLPIAQKSFKSENPEIRAAALALLGRNPQSANDELPFVVSAAKDLSPIVRTRALLWMYDYAKLGETPKPGSEPKAKKEVESKPVVLEAPIKIDAKAILPALVAGLTEEQEKIRSVARRALIALEEKAQPAIPEMMKLLDNPNRAIVMNVAAALVKLNVEDPRAVLLYNESRVFEAVTEYYQKQDNYLEGHWNDDRVHYFAKTYLETWGSAAKEYAASVNAEGVFTFSGYKMKVLHGQGPLAPGGKKSWMTGELLTSGHALIAWPVQPGVTGRTAFMSGPDGTIYERPFVQADEPKIPEMIAEFNPGPEWNAGEKAVKVPAPIQHDYFKPNTNQAQPMEF